SRVHHPASSALGHRERLDHPATLEMDPRPARATPRIGVGEVAHEIAVAVSAAPHRDPQPRACPRPGPVCDDHQLRTPPSGRALLLAERPALRSLTPRIVGGIEGWDGTNGMVGAVGA